MLNSETILSLFGTDDREAKRLYLEFMASETPVALERPPQSKIPVLVGFGERGVMKIPAFLP